MFKTKIATFYTRRGDKKTIATNRICDLRSKDGYVEVVYNKGKNHIDMIEVPGQMSDVIRIIAS